MLKRLTISSVGENIEQTEISYTAGGNVKWYSYFGTQFLRKLNVHLSHDPPFHFPGIN